MYASFTFLLRSALVYLREEVRGDQDGFLRQLDLAVPDNSQQSETDAEIDIRSLEGACAVSSSVNLGDSSSCEVQAN